MFAEFANPISTEAEILILVASHGHGAPLDPVPVAEGLGLPDRTLVKSERSRPFRKHP